MAYNKSSLSSPNFLNSLLVQDISAQGAGKNAPATNETSTSFEES